MSSPSVELDLSGVIGVNPPKPRSTSPSPAAADSNVHHVNNTEAEKRSIPFHNMLPPNATISHENAIHRIIIMLRAQGCSQREIAEKVSYSEAHVSQILRQPWARAALLNEITAAGRDPITDLLSGAAVDSINKIIEIRDTAEKDSDQLAAAKDLLDRFLGKPTQRVESHNTNLTVTPSQMSDIDRELAELEREEVRLTGSGSIASN